MFRNRLWSRLNYQLCAERSREGAVSQHPHPQHPGYAHPDPLVTLSPGPARLSRVRCLPGWWPCAPGASGSQELPAAQGPALFGGAESPAEPCGCNGQAVRQASQLAEALGADSAGWEGCTASPSGSEGAHQPCTPRDGRSVTRRHGPRLPPRSSLPAPRPPRGAASQPPGPAQPQASEQALPKIVHTARPLVLAAGPGLGRAGCPHHLPFTVETRAQAEAGRRSPAPQTWPLGRGCKPLLLPHSPHLPLPRCNPVGNPVAFGASR